MKKLTEENIQEIFELRRQGLQLQAIADKFGVTKGLISQILKRKRWKDVEGGLTDEEIKRINRQSQKERIAKQERKHEPSPNASPD